MSFSQKISKTLSSFCHEPIQIYLSSIWLMYGVFILFFGRGLTAREIPVSFIPLGHLWHGIILTIVGLIGFWGAISKKHRKLDLIFAVFSTFKSTALFLELVIIYPIQPEWINFFVRMVASVFLLHRSIFNVTHKC